MVKRMLMTFAAAALLAVSGCAKDQNEIEEQITLDKLPPAVRASFDKEFPGATVSEVEKEQYPDGTVHYGIEFTTKDGKKMEQEFDTSGKKLADH